MKGLVIGQEGLLRIVNIQFSSTMEGTRREGKGLPVIMRYSLMILGNKTNQKLIEIAIIEGNKL